MKKIQTVLAVAIALAFSVSAVNAQTSTSTSTGTATATAGDVTINNGVGSGTPSNTSMNVTNPAAPNAVTIKNVPAIMAPSLTTTLTETCMGSTSGGVAVAGFGVSLGGTWRDEECVNRLNARELRSFGDITVAREVMCSNAVVRAAFKKTGQPCIDDLAPGQAPSPRSEVETQVSPAAVSASESEYQNQNLDGRRNWMRN